MVIHTDYAAAAAALPEGHTLCGTYRGKDPVYFYAPKDADDQQMRELSFEAQNDRQLSGYEQSLLRLAIAMKDGQ